MRIALGIEYDGSGFNGWQSQDQGRTVQDCVELALSKVANEPVRVICAGRTDTGVHATEQVVHFDTNAERTTRSWMLGVNANLPQDVSVRWAKYVDDEFHARFKAHERSYRYVILNQPTRPALLRDQVCWEHRDVDCVAMHKAAQHLVGEHDYSSFRSSACQAKHATRSIYSLDVHRSGAFIYIDIKANAFLHHMVRNIAGVLLAIGRSEQATDWTSVLLAARDRTAGGVTAPAQGLYLVGVCYPEIFSIPSVFSVPTFS